MEWKWEIRVYCMVLHWWIRPSPGLNRPFSVIKVKLSLCLINGALRHEGVWGSGCIDPYFLYLGTGWRWVVSFTLLLLYPRGKSPPPLPVPIGKKAGWASKPVWTTWRRENSWPYRDSNSDVVQPVTSRYTDWAVPASLKLRGVTSPKDRLPTTTLVIQRRRSGVGGRHNQVQHVSFIGTASFFVWQLLVWNPRLRRIISESSLYKAGV
jgi:hypothetical protein